ncbi:MAG TPA: polyprenyl diphosphate synthase [Candidatus Baltobacteraceae bacterium]|nr:polyprenyl diphosphate synthase [Candidatus Baltobacteraceae bacterium]
MAHVAIIMDGNRRWALSRGLPLVQGYRRGIAALREAVRAAIDSGIDMLTVYGFSTENWRRDGTEIGMLMQLCAAFAATEKPALLRQGVRVRIVGDVEPFVLPARAGLRDLVRATEKNRLLTLNLALNYSGRAELVRAAQLIARDVRSGHLEPGEVDEAALRSRLYAPEMPDPDLLIRTGGDMRVSNFLLYQIAYTELLTLPVMWPDFTAEHFTQAVRALGGRERRFGA